MIDCLISLQYHYALSAIVVTSLTLLIACLTIMLMGSNKVSASPARPPLKRLHSETAVFRCLDNEVNITPLVQDRMHNGQLSSTPIKVEDNMKASLKEGETSEPLTPIKKPDHSDPVDGSQECPIVLDSDSEDEDFIEDISIQESLINDSLGREKDTDYGNYAEDTVDDSIIIEDNVYREPIKPLDPNIVDDDEDDLVW
ncbi:hypothetical protein HDE_13940 [Halotydeus destructor]|nr:hypothetical protein HDE_13940 [Halotydeus destructor]